MTLIELTQAAIKSLNESPLDMASLTIMIPGEKWGLSNNWYLAGPKSPQGRIVRETHEGIIVIFDSLGILAYCVEKGVNVEIIRNNQT